MARLSRCPVFRAVMPKKRDAEGQHCLPTSHHSRLDTWCGIQPIRMKQTAPIRVIARDISRWWASSGSGLQRFIDPRTTSMKSNQHLQELGGPVQPMLFPCARCGCEPCDVSVDTFGTQSKKIAHTDTSWVEGEPTR